MLLQVICSSRTRPRLGVDFAACSLFPPRAPESAPLKSKMIYASSKDAIKKKLTGIKHELQANCYEEVKDRCTLAEKLGGSAVISLEGKPL